MRDLAKVFLPDASVADLNPEAWHFAVIASHQARLVVCNAVIEDAPNPEEFLELLTATQKIALPEAANFGICIARLHFTGLILALIKFPKNFPHTNINDFVSAALNEVVIYNPRSEKYVTISAQHIQ